MTEAELIEANNLKNAIGIVTQAHASLTAIDGTDGNAVAKLTQLTDLIKNSEGTWIADDRIGEEVTEAVDDMLTDIIGKLNTLKTSMQGEFDAFVGTDPTP